MAKVIAVSSRAQHGAKRGFHNEEKCRQMQANFTAASMASYTETEKRFYVPYFSKYMTRGRKDIRAETESLRTSKVPPLNHSRKLQRPHIFTLSLICIVMQQASEGATGQGHFQALKWAKKGSCVASLRVGAIMESCWRHQISSVGLCACVVIAMNLSFSKRKLHLKLHWLRARS